MKELYSLTEHNYLVASGKIGNYYYAIRSTGYHPCAYVGADFDIRHGKTIDELDDMLPTHGGISYDGTFPLSDLDPKLNWLGWDYGHDLDYIMIIEQHPELAVYESEHYKKYTYEDIMKDIKNVIRYLEVLPDIEAITGD